MKNRQTPITKRQSPEIDIDYVARLANLPLSDSEKKIFEKQLVDILDYISQLSQVKTEMVEPIEHITGLTNITKDDTTAPSITQEEALSGASKSHNGFFEVEAIFEEN